MKHLLVLIFAPIVLLSCKDKKSAGWSQSDKDNYISTCEKKESNASLQNPKSYCACMLEQIVAKYPTPEDAQKMESDAEARVKMEMDCMMK